MCGGGGGGVIRACARDCHSLELGSFHLIFIIISLLFAGGTVLTRDCLAYLDGVSRKMDFLGLTTFLYLSSPTHRKVSRAKVYRSR